MAAQLLAYYRAMRRAGYTRLVARLRTREIIERVRSGARYRVTLKGRDELRSTYRSPAETAAAKLRGWRSVRTIHPTGEPTP